AAPSAVKLRLRDSRNVAVGDEAEWTDLVKHVRDRHPCDVDVIGSELLRQPNPCQGYSNQKHKCHAAHGTKHTAEKLNNSAISRRPVLEANSQAPSTNRTARDRHLPSRPHEGPS